MFHDAAVNDARFPEAAQDGKPESVSASTLAELDQRREAVIRDNTRENMIRFWEAVCSLPQWYFASRADTSALAQGSLPPVLTLNSQERNMVAFFSTRERASQAAARFEQNAGNPGDHAVLGMETRNALGFICSMDQGIQHVLFDEVPGVCQGFGTELNVIPAMYAHFGFIPPVACLGRMAGPINAAGHPQMFADAYKVLAHQDVLYMVQTAEGQIAMMEHPKGVVCPVFPDTNSAAAFKQVDDNRIVSYTPHELGELDELLSQRIGETYVGMIAHTSTTPIFIRGDLFREVLAAVPKSQRGE
ncbi:MAG: hypothetical protein KDA34_05985 [Phycisphaerales bacterium]|nr:hypothetical protein [Phycisphaerales bacterium]